MIKGSWRDPRKRRDRLYIISEILSIAKDGALKTQIMYKANLSFAQLNEYLSLLLEMKFLEPIVLNEKTIYKTTPKGLEYLQSYSEISDLLKRGGEKSNPLPSFKTSNTFTRCLRNFP